MPDPRIKGRPTALATLPLLLLACGGLAACGSSSNTPTTQTSANAANTTPAAAATTPGAATSTTSPAPAAGKAGAPPTGASGPSGPAGPARPFAARFAALRECLQKNGVTLPQRPAGAAGTGGPLGGRGAQQLPKGMTSAQYQAVLRKCGAGLPRGSGAFRSRHSFSSPTFRAALAKFGDCLRENGIDLPAANTSGKGPVFDTKGIDTSSPKFREAEAKCRSTLFAGLRARPGAAGGGATGR